MYCPFLSVLLFLSSFPLLPIGCLPPLISMSSLSLNERFSRVHPPPPPPSRRPQTVEVRLAHAQTQPKRKVVQAKKAQPNQPQPRVSVKHAAALSSSSTRGDRRSAAASRASSRRESAQSKRRAELPMKQLSLPSNRISIPIQSQPIQPLTSPFTLAPQFTQQAAFTMGVVNAAPNRPRRNEANTRGTKKPAQTNTKKNGAAPIKQQTNGRQRQPANQAHTQKKKKNAPGTAAKKQSHSSQPMEVSKDSLDADMDTYMSAAPQAASQ